jgi:hypothetical protein
VEFKDFIEATGHPIEQAAIKPSLADAFHPFTDLAKAAFNCIIIQ